MGTVLGQAVATAPPRAAAPSALLRWALAGLVGALIVVPTVLVAIHGTAALEGVVARLHLFSYVVALSFAVVAALVDRHQPGNLLAPLSAAVATGFAISTLCDRYATVGHDRGWPGAEWALWLSAWAFVPAMWAIPTLVVTLFPHGRLPSARWRPLAWVTAAALVAGTAGWALAPYGEVDQAPIVPLDNPVATDAWRPLFAAGTALWALAVAASLGGLASRVRSARGPLRAQLLWLLLGMAVAIAAAAIGAALGDEAVPSVGVVALPVALAVGVVRHGLWDVRVIVQRSLVYGALLVAIVAVYGATVALLGDVLGRELGAPLVATGLVAIGVQPVRDRLQRGASRLLYGDREDPYSAISRLGSQLDAAADRGSVLTGVTQALVRVMRLRGAAVTTDAGVVAQVGDLGPAPEQLALTVGGEPVGTLLVTVHDGDALTPADRRLLADLARHIAAVVRSERLAAELASSRARLVTAREEERRRIRRDLHDELGPTLAALANEVERAGLELGADPDAARARLDDVASRVRAAVRDVRSLVEGLHPAALDQLGLEGAVRELVRRLGAGQTAIEVVVDGGLDELPAAVEVCAYRIVSEAVTNVVRHADASSCTVLLRRAPGRLDVEVADDGRGIPPGTPAGVGRRSMAERAGELDGRLAIDSSRRGTTVRASLPVSEP